MTMSVVSDLLLDWDGKLPVDPSKFAVAKGISVLYDENLGKSGRSGYFSPDQRTIYVNPDEPEYRQRFTVAHELGQCLLGHGERNRANQKLTEFDACERDANQFAVELLMPEDAVRQLAPSNGLQMMAWYFDVSTTAMYFRMKNLRLVE